MKLAKKIGIIVGLMIIDELIFFFPVCGTILAVAAFNTKFRNFLISQLEA